jgi:hypothetical protein
MANARPFRAGQAASHMTVLCPLQDDGQTLRCLTVGPLLISALSESPPVPGCWLPAAAPIPCGL